MFIEHYYGVEGFLNRHDELEQIKGKLGKGVFGYVTGRRRIGKTGLLKQACQDFQGLYHQAVEGSPSQQLEHLIWEWRERIPLLAQVQPKTWQEFFSLLSREVLPKLLVLDEFPYLAMSDTTFASVLQKWIDHELPQKKTLLLVSGSSQSMLYSHLLQDSSPLYGRALLHLHLGFLSYHWFCKALGYKAADPLSFTRFALVGGVPHYWKLMPDGQVLEQVERLYFAPSAILSEEPRVILHDEGVAGMVPKSILDLVGRGVSKPGEIAARMGMPQGHLSRSLALLLELGLLHRDLPFGESTRTTKKVLYTIADPALSFYYGTYLPHRADWAVLSKKHRQESLCLHVSRQWEIACRQSYPGSSRYWEKNLEFDLVAPITGGRHLVAECKWASLTNAETGRILDALKTKFAASCLSRGLKNPHFAVLCQNDLPLAPRHG